MKNSLIKISKLNSWSSINYNFDHQQDITNLINYNQLVILINKFFKINFVSKPIVKLTSDKLIINLYYTYPSILQNNLSSKYLFTYLNAIIELYSVNNLNNQNTNLKDYISMIYNIPSNNIQINLIKLNSIILDAKILGKFLSLKYKNGKMPIKSSRLLFKLLNNLNSLKDYKYFLVNFKNLANNNIRLANVQYYLANQFITGCHLSIGGRLSNRRSADKSKTFHFRFGGLTSKPVYKHKLKGVTLLNGLNPSNLQLSSYNNLNKNGTYNVKVCLGMNN